MSAAGEKPMAVDNRCLRREPVDLAQLLLEQVGTVEGPVEPLEVGEL
jgi:hypothetical protein